MNLFQNISIGCLLLAPILAPAKSQMSVPAQTPDLSQYATTSAVSAAIAAGTPPACPILPPDTLMGSTGALSPCMPRQDSSRPTVVQATTVVTNSDGTFSGTWPTAFATTPTFRSAQVEIPNPGTPPIDCSFIAGSVTATGFQGKCAQLTATTLPSVPASLLGLVVSPIANAAGGQTVRIVGRQ